MWRSCPAVPASRRESDRRRCSRPLRANAIGVFIANMDVDREDRQDDDKIDDILRLEVRSERLEQGEEDVELTWWRSRNGVDQWREFR